MGRKKKQKLGTIPTFSINPESLLYSPKIMGVAAQMDSSKSYSPEYIYTLIKQITEKGIEVPDITAYTKQCEKFSQLKRATSKDEAILSEQEVASGYKGVKLEHLYSLEEIEDLQEVLAVVEWFLTVRERIYYQMGSDIFRKLELIHYGDTFAAKMLQLEAEEDIELKSLLVEIGKTTGTLTKLFEILA